MPGTDATQSCRPGWRHASPCSLPRLVGDCACGCVEGQSWCMENARCTKGGCGHDLYYHLDGSCWFNDNCVCSTTGRRTASPDSYLADVDMVKMMGRW